ncbi:hypothetical protein Achl_4404 (plasmid) [Pseudarthrobacter chlorophenolicus A6]|uniref:Uncharacterized protein n=1 Tax=Pseudarthrobacter chlorophenolicus (strain ATCC 700700 / DSM 12829 / CIP 107037 / JCM 12360 / KCTC 9906 / NCIMB 13794 / A6) TaxID=452863 RepID=B8HIV8_PSECP|nr:hypothetical protein [Pseudarthrobacter chlorophenolicus]ACL42355.1 hypothetical protein Achl_4404 [Pseudarthrobacter chlorophenolicus A6]SDQ16946.1 hypothetical protein SAMN04489738_0461 [Pseudarthrobacter chlorophenolicus]
MNISEKIKSRFSRKGLIAPARWTGFTAFSIAHIITVALALNLLPLDIIWWAVPLLIVLPGIISMTLLPGGWKRWYRWAALLGLVLMVLESSSNPFVVILFGETWMLHRAWITERTIPVRNLFRRGKAQEPVSAPAPKPKGSRRPKTA